MYTWDVVPLCEKQLRDIDPKDIVPGGVFRVCDVYKSGGGYDKFPAIYEKKRGKKTHPKQFVVQLKGCHLRCPYCYVTPDGIWGPSVQYTTDGLAKAFFTARKVYREHFDVFHLMGGSPGLYLEHWGELIDRLNNEAVFHSDLLLTEQMYQSEWIKQIVRPNCLYAVNIKGVTSTDYLLNTGREIDWNMFWYNLEALMLRNVPFYITFTHPDRDNYDMFCEMLIKWYGKSILEDSFVIDLVQYKALEAC